MSGSDSLSSSSFGDEFPNQSMTEEEGSMTPSHTDAVFLPNHHTNMDQMRFQVQIVVRPMSGAPNATDVTVTTAPTANGIPTTVLLSPSPHPAMQHHEGGRTPRSYESRSPIRRQLALPNIPRTPSPARRRSSVGLRGNKDSCANGNATAVVLQDVATPHQVSIFLRRHPEFLEKWLMEEVELEQLERWFIRRTHREKDRQIDKADKKTSLSRLKFCVHADKRQMLQELTQALQAQPDRLIVLWELSNCIASAVGADGFRLYLMDTDDNQQLMDQYLGHDLKSSKGEPLMVPVSTPLTVPEFIARSREPLRISRGEGDRRFPIPAKDSYGKDDSILQAQHTLWKPIIRADGDLVGVLLMWRRNANGPAFHIEDEEIARSYLVWGGVALHYAQLFVTMDKSRQLNDFLLQVVKSIFQDMVSMDALVVKVMTFAQRLVDADRASLFLLDTRNKELYARIFDMGHQPGGGDEDKNDEAAPAPPVNNNNNSAAKEIRFPLGTGIAGHVALTGEVLNIADAYSDPRFNKTVDQLTGYQTKSILCMPIFIRGLVIGVVQMVNKRNGIFNKDDEAAFETFAIYCGLALHHAKLYDKIQRSEQKYRVALEVLSYHNTCTEDELAVVKEAEKQKPVLLKLDDFLCNIYCLDEYEKVRAAVTMFTELFGGSRFDPDSVIRFALTVKKNYRRVPYHNWTHGFSVANSMYTILKHSKDVFSPDESLALYVGALCHDLDHRGKNNKFMIDTESPIATIYSTSTLEHHHFNQTVTILQQDGHNIFAKLSSEEYKYVLRHIKHCILATDLALFFPNKAQLAKIVNDKSFSWNNTEHRLLVEALVMTASDLSASCKPWDLQYKTVKVIYQEFYEQGDEEKLAGRVPMPLMDRDKSNELAQMQVGFLKGICIPCYELLAEILPSSQPLVAQCKQNLAGWEKISKEQKSKDATS